MIALNISLMTVVIVGIVSLLAWAIVSDRKSRRTAGGEAPPSPAPLSNNLVMPRELLAQDHASRSHAAHGRAAHAPHTRARAPRSTVA